jgi:8-oxo-dGTP diphosphatase
MSGVDPFDLVRDWFATFNRGDLRALEAFYSQSAVLEQDDVSTAGQTAVVGVWAERFAAWGPAFDGGLRRRLHMVGRIDGGLIHAQWSEREQSVAGGTRERGGHSDFQIERDAIVLQREATHDDQVGSGAEALPVVVPPSRQYPPRPVVGVGAVIAHQERVVLIRRRYEPLAGQWSLPGGTLELGESLEAGVAREMREETGLEVDVGPVIEVFDRILLDTDGRLRYHFVLIDYLCRPIGGSLQAGSDVDDAVWVDPSELAQYAITPKAVAIVERGLAMMADAFPTTKR